MTIFNCSEVVLLSLWNEFVLACEEFGDVDPRGSVISFTGLKTRNYKGFSLSTNYHTKINFNPIGNSTDELQKWFQDNCDMVLARTSITVKKENVPTNVPDITIKHALEMKATNITSTKVVKIAAYVPDLTVYCLRFLVNCNWYGKACDVPPEASYLCDSCDNYTISKATMFLDFDTTDGTRTLKLCANTRTAE